MELKNGYPYWLIRNGLPYQYPRLSENKTTGVVIIGGGISGALAAYHLVQKVSPACCWISAPLGWAAPASALL